MTEFETKMIELQTRSLERLEKIEAVVTWFQNRMKGTDQAMEATRRMSEDHLRGR